MMRYYIMPALLILFIFCLDNFYIAAQATHANDSAYKAISTLPDDTNKIKELLSLGDQVEEDDTVLCSKVYNEALSISKKINNLYFECKSLIYLGALNRTHEKYDAAYDCFQQALSVAVKSNIPESIGSALANIGNICLQRNDYDAASKNYLDAIPYLEKANNPRKLSIVIGNLCANFQDQGQYDKSIEYGLKSVEAALQSKDEHTIGLAYLNLCVPYYNLGNLNKYFEAAINALAHLRNASMKRDMCATYQNISSYYLEKGDVKNAKLYADSSLRIADELGYSKYIAVAMMMQGSIATESNDFTTARKMLADAKKYVDADNTWKSKSEWNKIMYRLENKSGNYKSAIDFLTAEHQYYDSLNNEKILEKNIALEKKYESQKKQSQITQLEKEKTIQQLTIQQKNNYLFILIGSLIAIAVIVFLYYKNNQRKEELAKQQILQLKQEKQLQAISGIVQTQEEERSRIAKDLHDGLGSLLSGVKLSLSSMKGNQIVNEEHAALFKKSIGQLDNAIAEMRRVAHNMMPEALLKFGLKEAIVNLCESLNESGTIKAYFEHPGFEERLSNDHEIVAYRMIQELVNNALKHAECKNIIIQLTKNQNIIQLLVEDDGKGFDATNLKNAEGIGYQNLNNRVEYLKGTINIKSQPGKGTSVLIEFPAT